MVSSSRLAVAAAALFSISSSTDLATPTEVELAFKEFKAKYGRVYQSAEEEAERFRTFETKFRLIKDENAKNMSYFLVVNAFTDQPAEEFQAGHLGMRAPPSSGLLWKGLPRLGADLYSGAPLPESVDWVAKGAVTKVKNQGSCGSCWAFSTTGSLEGSWFVSSGKLLTLSEQMLVDCNYNVHDPQSNNGCSGGSMDAAFDWLKNHDICTESSYPYKEKRAPTCRSKPCDVAIPKGGVTGYFDVPTDDTNALMEAVAQQPVSVAIEADQTTFQNYGGGVIIGNCGSHDDHGVLAVGYGTDKGMKYWKVKNSWGPDWGENGYVRIERGVKGDGKCGIKAMASYPKVDSSVSPSPVPPSPPSPAPVPAPPTPGCANKADYCSDAVIFDPKTDCALLASDCKKTCGCCDDSTAPDYCNTPATIVV